MTTASLETIDAILRDQAARLQQTRTLPAWPPAVCWLNYPHNAPDIGTVLGPNTMGEYLTVVDVSQAPRAGLAYGIVEVEQ